MSTGTSREERLTSELAEAALALDALGRSLEPGLMRTQQKIAGQRAKVLGLRAELEQIAYGKLKLDGENSTARRQEHRQNRDGLLIRIKEAELSMRAASKQATEDELPLVVKQLNAQTAMGDRFAKLH
jgi:hypothetical protein